MNVYTISQMCKTSTYSVSSSFALTITQGRTNSKGQAVKGSKVSKFSCALYVSNLYNVINCYGKVWFSYDK